MPMWWLGVSLWTIIFHLENGFWQSIGTGEGVVNTFRGTGEVYVQSLNLKSFAGSLNKYIQKDHKKIQNRNPKLDAGCLCS